MAFTIGALANAGRAMLMRLSGELNSYYTSSFQFHLIPVRSKDCGPVARTDICPKSKTGSRIRRKGWRRCSQQDECGHKHRRWKVCAIYLIVQNLDLLRSVTQNLSDGLRAVVMSSVGCEYFINLPEPAMFWLCVVGAMFYVSPTLTMLMLAVVPPVSLGAVCWCYTELKFGRQHNL